MAPLAENMAAYRQDSNTQQDIQGPPEKNVAFAVNYELPLVDQFCADTRKYRRKSAVEGSTVSTFTPTAADPQGIRSTKTTKPNEEKIGGGEEDIEQNESSEIEEKETEGGKHEKHVVMMTPPPAGRRVSKRDKAKRTNMARNRVRYDLQLVPVVQRNRSFLNQFVQWWRSEDKRSATIPQRPSRSSRNGCPCHSTTDAQTIFLEDNSVIWIPGDRREWDDTVSELTSVCTQAAIGRYPGNGPFVQPLSQEYIKDRMDIDDPLMGFQIRHRTGGWLQGFITYTNFTTWNHGFRWDSLHSSSGVATCKSSYKDADGSIAIAMESEPRFGELSGEGLVFPSIAEIALLGGLGCGEYLLRMALDDIRERKLHKFVVLQATDQSKTFYERFGFVRVGAVCQYGRGTELLDLAGYRHWTHANESQISLQKHGGPSYMMGLQLQPPDDPSLDVYTQEPGCDSQEARFLEKMMRLKVDQKPTILELGTAYTPAPKVFRRIAAIENDVFAQSLASPSPAPPVATVKKKPGPKPGRKRGRPPKLRPSLPTASLSEKKAESKQPKRKVEVAPRESPLRKRRKTSTISTSSQQINKTHLSVPSSNQNEPVKRKRGRPRKNPVILPPPPPTSVSKTGRVFHAVRGPDGKFSRVSGAAPSPAPSNKKSKRKSTHPSATRRPGRPKKVVSKDRPRSSSNTSRRKKSNPTSFISAVVAGESKSIDSVNLKKQKVAAFPRDRIYFYNRVVRINDPKRSGNYYFVLEFDADTEQMCLVPMEVAGKLKGKREGRPRYKCVLGETNSNFLVASCNDCNIVRSAVVMKTPFLGMEAWDLDTENDTNFETR